MLCGLSLVLAACSDDDPQSDTPELSIAEAESVIFLTAFLLASQVCESSGRSFQERETPHTHHSSPSSVVQATHRGSDQGPFASVTALVSDEGTGTGTDTMINSIVDNLGSTGQITPVELPILTDRYNVNVPIAEAAGRFSLAVLDRDYLVDLELTALEAEGRGEIVSTPRVITANQKEARIEQGVEIPYQQSASSGATTVQFKKAVLSLEVTPQITPDNNIIMDLRVHKDNVGDVISTGGLGGTVPSIDTRAVETQVLVEDGQTVVLGGIYETERRETVSKVPFLGDIPAVGVLFRSKQLQNDKSELLIFVTPRILEEGSTIY